MVMNLFSVFDPFVMGCQMNWVVVILGVFMLGSFFYLVEGGMGGVEIKSMIWLVKTFEELGDKSGKGVVGVMVGISLFLIYMNLLGLISFVFTSSAHLAFTLGLGLVMWCSLVVLGWSKQFKKSMVHLVPEGSPMILAPFLVLIESLSFVIRPFTLSVRLMANMMAGHLIIGLLGMISGSMGGFLVSVFLQLFLLILELGVAVIQGLVFGILLMLYMLESY